MDVSYHALEIAKNKLDFDNMNDKVKERIKLIQSSLMYQDKRLKGFDAATCIWVQVTIIG